ncbi:MAG: T9SS type A sorting domain-containing protein, partial [Leadbetterella sp.]|nr:T9SS type A sorting domain-containing protein [Leadbetterella sp.]
SDVFFTEETRLEVLDAAGRLLGTKILDPGLIWEVEFPGLPAGLYFLKLKTPLGTVGAKWVVH